MNRSNFTRLLPMGPTSNVVPATHSVIPAKAGIHGRRSPLTAMTSTIRRTLLALAAVTLLAPAAAQAQERMTVPPQDKPVALKGATIHTVTKGTIPNGTIVIDRGRITAVGGPEVAVPTGAKVIDVTGKHIYPGLIDAYSTVGLTEIGAVDVSNDIRENGDFNPNVRAEVAVNAESRHIGTTRSAGVLVAFSTPEGGVISGLSSALNLEGWTWEEMSMKGAAALNVQWPDPNARPRRFGGGGPGGRGAGGPPPKTYAEQVQQIKDWFGEARAYRDAVKSGQDVRTDSRYAAMIPALDGTIPVIVAADGAAQINDAITWGKAEGVKLVIRGGRDAIFVADRLKAENVPVILTSTMAAPDRDYEGYDGAYSAPAKLHAAGVKFAISGGSGGLYSNRLPWDAGVSVAFGLPEEEALKAVTINPATFMGIADKVGSLEVGKEGTLLITTGTPLDMTSNIEQSYIQGREINMMDIHKFFFQKYMEKIKQQTPKRVVP
jgi:imidazolonepropionase-like amidohydrolase